MLDQAIYFSSGVNARTVTIMVDKTTERIFVKADSAPGVEFSIPALAKSNGGILNDQTAQDVLNRQLNGKSK